MDYVCITCSQEGNDAKCACGSESTVPITYADLSDFTQENLSAAGWTKVSTVKYDKDEYGNWIQVKGD